IVELRRSPWRRVALPLSAAAGVTLAWVVTQQDDPSTTTTAQQPVTPVQPVFSGTVSLANAVPISHVEESAISTLESRSFALDLSDADQEVLFDFIRKSGRACPGGCVPKGLEQVPGLGCRKLDVDGKQ